MVIKVIIFWLVSNILNDYQEPGVDFNPRLFQKEVNNIFRDKEYRMSETPLSEYPYNSQLNGKFFRLDCADGESIMAYIGRVNSCRSGGCSNPSSAEGNLQSEYFDYFILFDAGKKVKVVRVFNYEATHGQEIIIKKWLDQFAGYDGISPLRVGKEVDTISGATISVGAIVADVSEKTTLLNKYN